jgi:hypothetical protein
MQFQWITTLFLTLGIESKERFLMVNAHGFHFDTTSILDELLISRRVLFDIFKDTVSRTLSSSHCADGANFDTRHFHMQVPMKFPKLVLKTTYEKK